MVALTLKTAFQNATLPKHKHVYGRIPSIKNSSLNLIRSGCGGGRAIILAALAPSTVNYLNQKQIDLFIHPLTTFPSPDHHRADTTSHDKDEEEMLVAKLRLVAAAAADRAEMHHILAQQRDGWNKLFHTAFTNITLAALILSALPNNNLAPTLLYGASAALMCGVNKIQPSQLAEEQRMAARLFRQLNTHIHTNLALPSHLRQDQHTDAFLDRAYKSVLALDKAYPLPLFPGMLDKFPKTVEPTLWWAPEDQAQAAPKRMEKKKTGKNINGWSAGLERDLIEVSETLKSGDIAEYVGLSRKVLQVNTILAVAGPLLSGIAGVLYMLSSSENMTFSISMSMVAGVLGMLANTLSHGGQIGMVFEMYRNSGGFYHFLDSSITRTLNQSDVESRENGELFLFRLALQLGRPVHSPLIDSTSKFAGKLF